jgi:hypothetical protein
MKEISKAEGHARQNIFTQNINYAFKGSAWSFRMVSGLISETAEVIVDDSEWRVIVVLIHAS